MVTDAQKKKLFAKMTRCERSLSNATRRYRTICQSTFGVVDRYNDTADELKAAGVWVEWCELAGSCPTHDASDYFA